MKTARQSFDDSMSEADLERSVVDMAHAFGWYVAGFRPARVTRKGQETWETPVKHDGKGFPDLVLVRGYSDAGRGLLFVEIKAMKGTLSRDQQIWANLIVEAGGRYYCWRPSDMDEIERVLK